MTRCADVLLPLPLDQAFTYAVPPDLAERVLPGMRVLVPFGGRLLTGFVIRARARKKTKGLELKPVAEALDEEPSFSLRFLSLTKKLSRHFFIPWGEILQAAVPPSFLIQSRAMFLLSQKGADFLAQGRLSPAEAEVAQTLKKRAYSLRYLERKLGQKNIASLLARMGKKELILVKKEVKRTKRRKDKKTPTRPAQLELDFHFDESLRLTSDIIGQPLARKRFSPFLVFGPADRRRGLYFDLIRKARLVSGEVLYLIPEISFTLELVQKIRRQLGEEVALLHSGLPERQRELEWQKIREKRARVVVGPRSAVLCPLDGVRLIILDEEQDESYDQREGSSFDVRKGAWLRAREEKATLVLGSAAPTVEAYYRAKKGGHLINLGPASQRVKVSLTESPRDNAVLSPFLTGKIREKLKAKEPAIVFFNRRGYAAHLVCARCGFVPVCPRCGQALSYHRKDEKLACHSCRTAMPKPQACSRCGSRFIEKRRPGIEAVAEELRKAFPRNRVEVFATDEAGKKKEREMLLSDFRKGEIDILIGTNFLAHQPGIPPVTLVGILHPEMILHLADFRSGQKAFQAVTRALRFLGGGQTAEAVIQTSMPDHFAVRSAAREDYEAFYGQEIKFRRLMGYPPFSCLAEVVFEGTDPRRVAKKAREFVAKIKESGQGVEIFGPTLRSSGARQGLRRVVVGLKAGKKKNMDKILFSALRGIPFKKSVFLFD
ncbi:MAG: primosomal protein N' [Candidatus Aminicenantes bacterium]|nr:primosomal protein N' [Candidatus Aminicenantes bacterium]